MELFLAYVQEAHTAKMDSNVEDSVLFRQHQTSEERDQVANTYALEMKVPIPTLIEEMDNGIDDA